MVHSYFESSPRLGPSVSAVSLESSATSQARYHTITHFPINDVNESQLTLGDRHIRNTSNKSALSDPFSHPSDGRISATAYHGPIATPNPQPPPPTEATHGHTQQQPSDTRNPLRSDTVDTMDSQATSSTLVAEQGSEASEGPTRLFLKVSVP